MKQPKTLKMKYMRNSKLVTLISAGKEKTMTAISLWSPWRFLMSLRIRETRSTLKTRISWGAKEKLEVTEESIKRPINRSITEAKTMNKSNLLLVNKIMSEILGIYGKSWEIWEIWEITDSMNLLCSS